METIRQGMPSAFTLTLTQNAAAYPLSDTTATLTVRDSSLTPVLVQYITINGFGVVTSNSGLTLGSGGATAGVLEQEITGVETALLPLGTLSWILEITDSTLNSYPALWGQYQVVASTYIVGVSGPDLTSLADLRRMVANRLGDYDRLDTTAASDSSHIIDSMNVSGATETFNGRVVVCRNGPNAGLSARVQSTDPSTNTLSITPALLVDLTAGITFDVFNTRSRGWMKWEYDQAINEAIKDGRSLNLARYTALISTFDYETPYFPLPDVFEKVYAVGALDSRTGLYTDMPTNMRHGWSVGQTPAGAVIQISRQTSLVAHDRGLQVSGYGTHALLVSDTDQTSMPSEWIVARAAYHLAVNGITRDDSRGNLILLLQGEAKVAKTQMRTTTEPHTRDVR